MAIPKYNEMYVDYLEALADGQPHKNAEIRATVAAARNLTPEDLALTIPSGWPLYGPALLVRAISDEGRVDPAHRAGNLCHY